MENSICNNCSYQDLQFLRYYDTICPYYYNFLDCWNETHGEYRKMREKDTLVSMLEWEDKQGFVKLFDGFGCARHPLLAAPVPPNPPNPGAPTHHRLRLQYVGGSGRSSDRGFTLAFPRLRARAGPPPKPCGSAPARVLALNRQNIP